jgi:group II intron reverse transcriptase/maturase
VESSKGKTAVATDMEIVSTRQRRIAELARQLPELAVTSLNHHIDLPWMREAFRRTNRKGAPGVDGEVAETYEQDLEGRLRDLIERAKSGLYVAPPVRRVFIPKGDGTGEQRPIGIPTLEDKVLQRAVVMLLEPLYEQDFLDVSYGFRPGRSPHQALHEVRERLMGMGGGWVVELDIRKFYDTIDRKLMQQVLDKRVRDGVVRRLIGKWLHAGVFHEGCVSYPDAGTPQGGVISPLLANVFLHEVLDTWFHEEVRPRLVGQGHLVRFADDAVMAFTHEADARRVLEVLPKRFEKYGLTLHPEKTRIVAFRRPPKGRPPGGPDDENGEGGPGTFDFLGFTHHWAKSAKGYWVIKRKTAAGRMSRKLRELREWCRRMRHEHLSVQCAGLGHKLQGHYAYFGIRGNFAALRCFYDEVIKAWRKWLGRRSHRAHRSWYWFARMRKRYGLPQPRIVHAEC